MKTVVVSSSEKFIQLVRTHELFAEAPVISLENVRIEDVENMLVASDALPARLAARARAVLDADGRWRRLAQVALPPWEEPVAFGGDDVPLSADYSFFRVGGAYFFRHAVVPLTARKLVAHYRAGITHTGFSLIADSPAIVNEQNDYVFGVGEILIDARSCVDGQGFIVRGRGGWDIYVLSIENYIEPQNDLAHVLAVDTARNGVGKALVALRPGAVMVRNIYKRRGPARVLWYVGGGYWREAPDIAAGRAMEWLGKHNDYCYEKVL